MVKDWVEALWIEELEGFDEVGGLGHLSIACRLLLECTGWCSAVVGSRTFAVTFPIPIVKGLG